MTGAPVVDYLDHFGRQVVPQPVAIDVGKVRRRRSWPASPVRGHELAKSSDPTFS